MRGRRRGRLWTLKGLLLKRRPPTTCRGLAALPESGQTPTPGRATCPLPQTWSARRRRAPRRGRGLDTEHFWRVGVKPPRARRAWRRRGRFARTVLSPSSCAAGPSAAWWQCRGARRRAPSTSFSSAEARQPPRHPRRRGVWPRAPARAPGASRARAAVKGRQLLRPRPRRQLRRSQQPLARPAAPALPGRTARTPRAGGVAAARSRRRGASLHRSRQQSATEPRQSTKPPAASPARRASAGSPRCTPR
mmetsp:Transcript_34565/g.120599  ORF Transcript_34565/g.120599 Transcript_34565/m.120599 type:complete len:249 (-) Transcript_34565:439-1185(-)